MTELSTVHNLMTTLKSSPSNFTQCLLTPPSGSSPKLGIAILSLAFIVGFSGNVFIIWTILFRMKKRTVTCILIFHLAVADIMVILTAPFFLHLLSTGSWTFGNAICKLCHYISCLSMYASIFLITFMSMDRFLAVAKPFSSQKLRTKPVVRMLIFIIWVLAILLAIPMLIYYKKITLRSIPICYPCHSSPQHIVFQYLFETMLGFVIPFTVIVYCYTYIGIRLRSAKFQSKQKTSRLVILIVVTFALFWIPYHVVNILQVSGNLNSGPTGQKLKQAASFARPNATALAFLSSSINPILYAFAGGTFIRTAGIGFMAKLFEGTSSEVSSFRKVSQVFRQRSRNESVEMGKLGEESKTFSTNQTE
ncbi:leukotriene B4 receptor 1 [Bombina bombina]|uniref:leukotriene B4 receptor 1 n=1 Tax=Bombina bombina TaxID=8345 RepID=UPI00235AC68B|nr:leukotriene B4 receptor 1 [Bombina bombina]